MPSFLSFFFLFIIIFKPLQNHKFSFPLIPFSNILIGIFPFHIEYPLCSLLYATDSLEYLVNVYAIVCVCVYVCVGFLYVIIVGNKNSVATITDRERHIKINLNFFLSFLHFFFYKSVVLLYCCCK